MGVRGGEPKRDNAMSNIDWFLGLFVPLCCTWIVVVVIVELVRAFA